MVSTVLGQEEGPQPQHVASPLEKLFGGKALVPKVGRYTEGDCCPAGIRQALEAQGHALAYRGSTARMRSVARS
jgi:hypothetical protein